MRLMGILAVAVAVACGGSWAAEPRVRLTDTGAMLVGGKPFLAIFAWAQPSRLIEFHKLLGINTMHPGEPADSDPPKAYLGKLRAADMMGLFNMGLFSDDLKGHPALLARTVKHEPDGARKPAFQESLSGDATAI